MRVANKGMVGNIPGRNESAMGWVQEIVFGLSSEKRKKREREREGKEIVWCVTIQLGCSSVYRQIY
jgi:hypothetical protein